MPVTWRRGILLVHELPALMIRSAQDRMAGHNGLHGEELSGQTAEQSRLWFADRSRRGLGVIIPADQIGGANDPARYGGHRADCDRRPRPPLHRCGSEAPLATHTMRVAAPVHYGVIRRF